LLGGIVGRGIVDYDDLELGGETAERPVGA
jgi:hypothetical protein